jgi:hypothetical protein
MQVGKLGEPHIMEGPQLHVLAEWATLGIRPSGLFTTLLGITKIKSRLNQD